MASDDQQPYPLIKQSQVRKLRTYASSISSNSSSASSARTSPNSSKGKRPHHHAGDTDEGYASFTTNSTVLVSQNSGTLTRDDSAYYTSTSDHLPTLSSSSSSKAVVETDSEKSELSDEEDDEDEDTFRDLVDWPSLNQQVQTLVSRLDKWLHHPLPDRSIPIEKSHVDHAYPILQRRTSSIPLSINLAGREPTELSHQTNYAVNFIQNSELGEANPSPHWKMPRPRVHFQLENDQSLQHCANCSRLIQLTSSTSNQRSTTICPYCEQVYCNKSCQKSDWPIHKRSCILSNSYSCCGYILRLMKSNSFLLKRLSTLASSGYLSSGRGATLLYFDGMTEADTYVQSSSVEKTRLIAIYWSLKERKGNRAIDNLRSIEYDHLKELGMTYDPRTEFVCHVTIRVEADTDDTRYTCVSRTMIYKLSDDVPETPSVPSPPSTYPTLYLTSMNFSNGQEKNHRMRQVFFAKLQVELRERGIEIEEHYPELYNKLCDYISPDADEQKIFSFTPVCLFMRHRYSQQLFMCVVNPESEPDRSWLLDRCLVEKQLVTCDN